MVPAGVDNYCPHTCQGACSCSSSGCGPSYGYTPRQCTGFLAFRANQTLGIAFGAGKPIGFNWGNAVTWAAKARASGVAVDGSPRVRDFVCMPNISQDGHVAFVLEVGPSAHATAGHVWVEDYNYELTCSYHQHAIAIATSGSGLTEFIHLASAAPPPPPTMTGAEMGAGALIVLGVAVVLVGRNRERFERMGWRVPGSGGYETKPLADRRLVPVTKRSPGYEDRELDLRIAKRASRIAKPAAPSGYARERPGDLEARMSAVTGGPGDPLDYEHTWMAKFMAPSGKIYGFGNEHDLLADEVGTTVKELVTSGWAQCIIGDSVFAFMVARPITPAQRSTMLLMLDVYDRADIWSLDLPISAQVEVENLGFTRTAWTGQARPATQESLGRVIDEANEHAGAARTRYAPHR